MEVVVSELVIGRRSSAIGGGIREGQIVASLDKVDGEEREIMSKYFVYKRNLICGMTSRLTSGLPFEPRLEVASRTVRQFSLL
jgi:hypothetical protein